MQKYDILKTRFRMRVGSVPDPNASHWGLALT